MLGGKIYTGKWTNPVYDSNGNFMGTWENDNNKDNKQIIKWKKGKWTTFTDTKKIYEGILYDNNIFNKGGSIKWIGNYNTDGDWDGEYTIIPQEYIAELYEYKIENYSDKKYDPNSSDDYKFTFNRFKEKKEDECGIIIAKSDKTLLDIISNNNYKHSCDILIDTGDKDILLTNEKIKKLYENIYLKENSKKKIGDFKDTGFFTEYCTELNIIINDLTEKYKKLNLNISTNTSESYIHKVDFKADQKIIVIGDIHGGFHTLFRLLMRFHFLKILNMDTFEINDGYTIIFLGDIVDRGAFQIETLYLLFNLLYTNLNNNHLLNPKIIYNRGNHETENLNSWLGFKEDVENTCIINSDEIYKNTNILFDYFPVAIIINNMYWLSHGGIPTKENNTIDAELYKSFINNTENK